MQDAAMIGAAWIETRVSLLRRLAAAFFLLLMAATWPLWTPEHAFPQVPMFRWLGWLPDGAQWLSTAGLLAALTATMLIPGRFRRAAALTAGVAVLLAMSVMAFDQHRWQAWTYHLTLCLTAIALLPAASAMFWLRWLTISIYAYSAWSKFDHEFLTTLGPEFAVALAKVFHCATENWTDEFRSTLAGVFPAGEMLVAIALAWPVTRRFGVLAAILCHITLFLILGPWGLDHRWGVLIWNAFFILQDPLLMLPPLRFEIARATPPCSATIDRHDLTATAANPKWSVRGLLGRAVMILALIAPLGEPWGWCDHWMAWSLYAPRMERIQIAMLDEYFDDWPESLRPFLVKSGSHHLLRADRWSLRDSRAPLVPQVRFQLAVAVRVAEMSLPSDEVCVIRFGPADRWTGKREMLSKLNGEQQILDAADTFWLNARPRETNPRPAAAPDASH